MTLDSYAAFFGFWNTQPCLVPLDFQDAGEVIGVASLKQNSHCRTVIEHGVTANERHVVDQLIEFVIRKLVGRKSQLPFNPRSRLMIDGLGGNDVIQAAAPAEQKLAKLAIIRQTTGP